MTEIKLLLRDSDVFTIVSSVLSSGAFLVPDLNYEKKAYEEITTISDFKKYFRATKLFFILHDSWKPELLTMEEFPDVELSKKYFIRQKSGGPSIILYCCGEYDKDGTRYIGNGFIGYHRKYWSTTQRANIAAPESLRDFYKLMISSFKKNAIRMSGTKVTYWVDKQSKEELDSNKIETGLDFLR